MPGGWKGSTRRLTLPDNWADLVAFVRTRAHGRCEATKQSTGRRCTNAGSDCDHKVRPADGGTDDPSNLQWLCRWHHRHKTSQEGNAARAAQTAAAKRPAVKHPGLR